MLTSKVVAQSRHLRQYVGKVNLIAGLILSLDRFSAVSGRPSLSPTGGLRLRVTAAAIGTLRCLSATGKFFRTSPLFTFAAFCMVHVAASLLVALVGPALSLVATVEVRSDSMAALGALVKLGSISAEPNKISSELALD